MAFWLKAVDNCERAGGRSCDDCWMTTHIVLPTYDLAFKKLFANDEHPEIVQGFLKDFLDFDLDIAQIRIKNPDSIRHANIEANVESDEANLLRATYRDITIAIDTADITIEMQLVRQSKYLQRALYYLADLYTSNYGTDTAANSLFDSLKPVWSISILGFNLFADDVAFRVFSLRDEDAGVALEPKLLRLGFLELRKPIDSKAQARWRKFFISGKVDPDAPQYLKNAAAVIAYHNLTAKERKMIDAETKARDISRAIMAGLKEEAAEEAAKEAAKEVAAAHAKALSEGKAAGIAEGRAEGIAQGRRETAQAMLSRGFDLEVVADLTGLSVKELKDLE